MCVCVRVCVWFGKKEEEEEECAWKAGGWSEGARKRPVVVLTRSDTYDENVGLIRGDDDGSSLILAFEW